MKFMTRKTAKTALFFFLFCWAAINCAAQNQRKQNNVLPRVGAIKEATLNYGCGFYFSFSTGNENTRKYIFLADDVRKEAFMNAADSSSRRL